MINDDLSAHTYRDHGPIPILRNLRRASSGLGFTLLVLSVSLLTAGAGAGHNGVRVLNLGLTLANLAGMCGVVVAGAFIGELIIRYVRRVVDDLEAGERAIAGAIEGIVDPPDELGERRRGGG